MEKKNKTFDDVKKEIRSLLLSSPVGLRLQDLVSDYRAMIGVHLPFQELGYSSATELIRDMPTVVCPKFRAGGVMYLEAVADSTTMHIKKLVHQQKRNGTRVSRIRKIPDQSVRRPPPKPVVPPLIRMKLKELLRSFPEGLAASSFGDAYAKRFGADLNFQVLGFRSLKSLFDACPDIVFSITKEKSGIKNTVLYLKKGAAGSRDSSTSSVMSDHSMMQGGSDANSNENQKPSTRRSVVKSPPRRTLSSSTRSSSSSTAGQSQALRPSNTRANSAAVRRTSESTSLDDIEPEMRKGKSQSNQVTKKKAEPLITSRTGVSDELKSEIKTLLERKKNGVWLARLPFEYKREFKKDLDVKAAGYFSLIAMLGSLPNMVKIDRPVENGDWLLSAVHRVADTGIEDPLPKDAVKYDGNFQKMIYPTDGQMEIYIVQIDHPGSFFFHWCTKKTALDDLMERMSIFYKSISSQSYLLPASHRKTGQVCATIYDVDGEWYRAIIGHVITDIEVEVIYADYGNKARVPTTSLRLLKKDFIELPSMCIRGFLANIKPAESQVWSEPAKNRFFNLTRDKALLGRICCFENDAVGLHLIDANYRNDIHINDTLVIERLALYKSVPARRTVAPPVILNNPISQVQLRQPVSSLYQLAPSPLVKVPLGMDALLRQYDAMQLAAFFPHLFMPIQNAQPAVPIVQNINQFQQQPSVPPVQRIPSTTIPPQPIPGPIQSSVHTADVKEEKESINVDSLIECINAELDDRTSSDEAINEDDVFVSEEEAPRMVNVKRIPVPERYELHAIRHEGKPHATRAEIAALLWHKDILRQMLRQQKVAVSSIVISKEDNPALFDECVEYDIKGMVENKEIKDFLTLYDLESVRKILDVFKHQSEELKTAINEEISQYKNFPERYWQIEAEVLSGSEEDIEEDSLAWELELEELRLLHQAMQFRRKRLVNSLMSKTPCPDTVDELKRVEEEIEKIRKKIQKKEGIVN